MIEQEPIQVARPRPRAAPTGRRRGLLATWILATAPALGWAPACGGDTALPESGAVLLKVTLPASGPIPDQLRAWVYDQKGVLFKNAPVPAHGALHVISPTEMGTLLIQPGAAIGNLRIHLRAFGDQQRRFDGIAVVTPAMRHQPMIEVALDPRVPADVDGDDVPDVVDDCLPGYNPDQGGCLPGKGGDASSETGRSDGSPGGGGGGSGVDAGAGGDAGPGTGAGGSTAGAGGATGSGGAPGVGGATGIGGAPSGVGGATGIGGSSGCGTAASGSPESQQSMRMNEGGNFVTRQYWLSRPADYSPQRAYRLIVALGAPASSVTAIRQQVGLQDTGAAGAADEIFAYPYARVRNFGSWGTVTGWQLGPGARNTNAAGLDDLNFIDAMLSEIQQRQCIDSSRVFVVGYGWGSDFANALACVRGRRLRAIAGAANNGDYYVKNPVVACQGSVGNWVFQGKGDTRLGLARGMVTLSFWLGQHACSSASQPLVVSGPSGDEDCVSYTGCTAPTRWCATDASFGTAAPSYLGREALGFFRGM